MPLCRGLRSSVFLKLPGKGTSGRTALSPAGDIRRELNKGQAKACVNKGHDRQFPAGLSAVRPDASIHLISWRDLEKSVSKSPKKWYVEDMMYNSNMQTTIYAHRGVSACHPENTLEAFSAAVEQGADGIELDVHLTQDGEIVVAHDERLERVSDGTGYINDHTLEELKTLNFGKLFPNGPVCRIPLLSEVFSLIKPSSLALNVELKTTERVYPELPEKLTALTREYAMEERVIYSSFNHYSLMQIKKIDPGAKIGLLYDLGVVDPWVYAKYLGADAIHPHYYIIAMLPETVARCHEHGIKVNVWTAEDDETIKLMFKCAVDGIITDKPDAAITYRDGLTKGKC